MAIAAPLSDAETIHRRVPRTVSFTSSTPPRPPWTVFKPRAPNDKKPGDRGDVDGLSVDLATLRTAKATSEGSDPTRPYSVVALTVGQIRQTVDSAGAAGMDVVGQPVSGNEAHALIPQVNWTDYSAGGPSKMRISEWAEGLARQCVTVIQV